MTNHSRVILVALAALVMALAGCGDDNSPTGGGGGPTDTTPPGIVSVTTIDGLHIDVLFDEDLNPDSAERHNNYIIIETSAAPVSPASVPELAAPGDTLHVASASLNADQRTVSLSTHDSMSDVPYSLMVTNVADLNGNRITEAAVHGFQGTSDPDVTPPQIVSRSPQPNATGVGTGQPVVVRFSERVNFGTVMSGASWTSTAGDVFFDVSSDDEVEFVLTQTQPLTTSTVFTVSFAGVQDYAGNTMPTATWSFTTTSIVDTDPPTLESSFPLNGATNVDVNTNLSLTFSEAVNQSSLQAIVTPDVGSGIETWSNQGKTITFEPNAPLVDNQAYSLVILPGGVRDLAGNAMTQIVSIQFTTGSSFPSGRISGTITGDPTSNSAMDPTGALVIAADRFPFGDDDFGVGGSAVVADNNTYAIQNLPDHAYWPVCAMDSNGDGTIDPEFGDAIGAYGADLSIGDFTPDSVVVAGGANVTGVNFSIFDGSAISGQIAYSGMHQGSYMVFVGAFDANAFDPTGPPDFGTSYFYPSSYPWVLGELDGNLGDGTYYIAAFMDVNFNGIYDPATDPAGIYGGTFPTPVAVQGGDDLIGILIVLLDPAASMTGPAVSWGIAERSEPTWVQRLSAVMRERSAALRE